MSHPVAYVPDVTRIMPVDLYRDLSALELRIIMLLWRMCRSNVLSGRAEHMTCLPSEPWIGEHVGAHPKSVSRALGRLCQRGLLHIRQTRHAAGRWGHNIYRCGNVLISLMWSYLAARYPSISIPGNLLGGESVKILLKRTLNGDAIMSYLTRCISRLPGTAKKVYNNKITTTPRTETLRDGSVITWSSDRATSTQQFLKCVQLGLL